MKGEGCLKGEDSFDRIVALRSRLKRIRRDLHEHPLVVEANQLRSEVSSLLAEDDTRAAIARRVGAALEPILHELKLDERPPARIVFDAISVTIRLNSTALDKGDTKHAVQLLEAALPTEIVEMMILSLGPKRGVTTRSDLDYFAGRQSDHERTRLALPLCV